MNQKWGSEFAYEFVDDGLDWARYRLSEARDYCHPSAYGYARIALFLRNILAANLPGVAAGIQAR
jgi:lysophospholipase L1-like esterase